MSSTQDYRAMTAAERIEYVRKARSVSVGELIAEMTHIGPAITAEQYTSGRLTVEDVHAAATAFDISHEWALHGTGNIE